MSVRQKPVGQSQALLDDRYVKKSGDTMTGDLTLPYLTATDVGESSFNSNVNFNGGLTIRAGQKIIFDGA